MASLDWEPTQMVNHLFSQAWLLVVTVSPLVAVALFSAAGYKW